MHHFYQNIHGWMDFENLYSHMVNEAHHLSHFVEVGSWKGKSSAFMCVEIANSGKIIRFDCVDTWQGSDVHQTGGPFEDHDCVNGELLTRFQENMAPVTGRFNTIISTSVQAAQSYANWSLDFVFIDADHSYPSMIQDITAWLPKIKPGGYLAGHDYPNWAGVKQAVDELLPQALHYPPTSWIYHVPG
jgi:hypothetical protein